MEWQKQGLIYAPDGALWWAKSHAYVPTAEIIQDEGIIRIYFASWTEDQVGRIGYIDVDADNPKRVLHLTKEPVLDIGEADAFDGHGVSPSCILNVRDQKYLYYFGFRGDLILAGLAISGDGGRTFERHPQNPILPVTVTEPTIRSSATVAIENGLFRMWYTAASPGWVSLKANPLFTKDRYPRYAVRYLESLDGIHWPDTGQICVDLAGDEFALGRPWVIKENGIYKMWYSVRSLTIPYRIGYAESVDGLEWHRKDDIVGIEISASGWDSEMICFPCVVGKYMFYNGNRHGRTGVGYAER